MPDNRIRQPRIVVLDGHTANPGDLDWAALESQGELTVWPRSAPSETISRCASAPIVLTNKVLLGAEELAALPELSYIGVLATGTNVVDLPAATARGVVVTNVPAYSTASVAQLTLALLLELTHAVGAHSQAVHQGRWAGSPDFCFYDQPLVELDGLRLGLIGLGAIGQDVAALGAALGMEVVGTSRAPKDVAGVRWVPLDELLATSDVVSLHCPLTEETRGLVDAASLSQMKPTAYLLNTARGPLIDEPALAAALQAGRLAGAGLDVLSSEPPAADNPLLTAPRCIITPHLAWASVAARRRLIAVASENVRAWLAGRPRNVVS